MKCFNERMVNRIGMLFHECVNMSGEHMSVNKWAQVNLFRNLVNIFKPWFIVWYEGIKLLKVLPLKCDVLGFYLSGGYVGQFMLNSWLGEFSSLCYPCTPFQPWMSWIIVCSPVVVQIFFVPFSVDIIYYICPYIRSWPWYWV